MKKITILMVVMTLMLISTASWAPKPEVMQVSPSAETLKLKCESATIHLFSKNPMDFMLTLHQNRNNDKHFIVYYGKLMPNHDFSDLMEIFNDYGDDYHPNIDKAIDQNEDVADQKMQPFFWNTSFVDRTAMPSNCEPIQNGTSFRCTSKELSHTKGKPLENLIEGYGNTWVSFRAADPCFFPTGYWKFPDLLARGENDDKNKNGIPDSFETPIITFSKTPSIESPPEEEASSSEELSEVSDESTPSTDSGTPLFTDDQTASSSTDKFQADLQAMQIGSEEGSACSLAPTAAANPASFFIVAALLALVRRRGK